MLNYKYYNLNKSCLYLLIQTFNKYLFNHKRSKDSVVMHIIFYYFSLCFRNKLLLNLQCIYVIIVTLCLYIYCLRPQKDKYVEYKSTNYCVSCYEQKALQTPKIFLKYLYMLVVPQKEKKISPIYYSFLIKCYFPLFVNMNKITGFVFGSQKNYFYYKII